VRSPWDHGARLRIEFSAGIAQLVEQRFCKPLVVGSIPTAGISNIPLHVVASARRRDVHVHCSPRGFAKPGRVVDHDDHTFAQIRPTRWRATVEHLKSL
jgi:hypothetical protein